MKKNRDVLLRNVIKEELVILTKHRDEAAILSQFLYWTPRCKTFEGFLIEEKNRMKQEVSNFEGGWIYKSADELKHELLMIDTNVKTIRKYLKSLVDKGFLFRRKNPNWGADRTYHYRINLRKIAHLLNSFGHHVEGFEQFSIDVNETKIYCLYERNQGHSIGPNLSVTNSQNIIIDSDNLVVPVDESNFPSGKMSAAIPEVTSEILNKEQHTNNTLELNDDYNAIKIKFLNISSKNSVSKEDQQLILDVLALVNDVPKISSLMEDCYELKNSIDLRAATGESGGGTKGIWSFKYIYNYILKELDNDDRSIFGGVLGREESISEEVPGESNTDASNVGWIDDIKCDF